MQGEGAQGGGGLYGAWASQGWPGIAGHFSMVQLAPSWHPMEQSPLGQSRMLQLAPAAHWIWQGPVVQVSITQVAPAEQW
jgi:hypothetical protein